MVIGGMTAAMKTEDSRVNFTVGHHQKWRD